jgi:hypothetical protein
MLQRYDFFQKQLTLLRYFSKITHFTALFFKNNSILQKTYDVQKAIL